MKAGATAEICGAGLNEPSPLQAACQRNLQTYDQNNLKRLESYLLALGDLSSIDSGIFVSQFRHAQVTRGAELVCALPTAGPLSVAEPLPMNQTRSSPPQPLLEAVSIVREIYADLAARPVERACTRLTECCQFQRTGLTPYLTKGEALVAARAWRATGRKKLPEKSDGACPLLDPAAGRCLVYADRPFGCRTHFCAAAGGPMARREVLDLIRRLETVDAQLGGDGPRKLPAAVAAALGEIA